MRFPSQHAVRGADAVHLASALAVDAPDLIVAVWDLRLHEGGNLFHLGPGDCLGFGAPGEVIFSNETDRSCFYCVALTRS